MKLLKRIIQFFRWHRWGNGETTFLMAGTLPLPFTTFTCNKCGETIEVWGGVLFGNSLNNCKGKK